MTPVPFWDRDIRQAHAHRDVNTSGLRPTFDPQHDPRDTYRSPRPRFRDADGHDLARDEHALDPFDEGDVGGLPADDLQDLRGSTLPLRGVCRGPAASSSPDSRPRDLSRVDGTGSPSHKQPGRANDRAA